MSEPVEIEVPGPVVRARIGVAQVERYLARMGWVQLVGGYWMWPTSMRLEMSGIRPYVCLPSSPEHYVARLIEWALAQIGEAEGRPLHLVLADIAAEVVE